MPTLRCFKVTFCASFRNSERRWATSQLSEVLKLIRTAGPMMLVWKFLFDCFERPTAERPLVKTKLPPWRARREVIYKPKPELAHGESRLRRWVFPDTPGRRLISIASLSEVNRKFGLRDRLLGIPIP